MANIIRPLEINKPSWLQRLRLRPFRGVKAASTTPQNPVPVSASQLASQQRSLQITPAVPARVDPPQLLSQGNTGIDGAKNAIKRYFATIEPAQRLTERFSARLFKSSLLLPLQGVMTTGLLLLGANLLPLAGLGLAAGLAGSLLPLAITAISVRLVDRSRAAKAAREINRFDHDLLAEAISELKTGDREMIYRVVDQNKRGMIAQRVAAVDSGCVIVREEWIEEQELAGPEPEQAEVRADVQRGAWRRLLERFVKQMRTPYRNIRTFIELLPEGELKANLDRCFRDKVVYLADVVDLLEGDIRSVIGADAALWRAWDGAYEEAVNKLKKLDPEFSRGREPRRLAAPRSGPSPGPIPAPEPPAEPAKPNEIETGTEITPQNYPVVSETAIELRERVRQSDKRLLFTRNIDLAELQDMISCGKIRPNGAGVKYFRYGLSHEYGELGSLVTIVMRPEFWGNERAAGYFQNMFLHEVDGQQLDHRTMRRLDEDELVQHGELLSILAKKADYNRLLDVRPPQPRGIPKLIDDPVGSTIMGLPAVSFMGNFPQLEIPHDLELDQVEKILVPEHLWAKVTGLVAGNPRLAQLLEKVAGTGETSEEFLAGRERLGRRSRYQGGRFEPNFGYESFHLFEQAYFRLVLGADDGTLPYLERAIGLIEQYGYHAVPMDWLRAFSRSPNIAPRGESGWKIFVNPRQTNFFTVLEAALKVLGKYDHLVEQYKVPLDLNAEWRPGRPFGSASNTPKITIYVEQETLPVIIKALEAELVGLNGCGFGSQPGPSFARRFGSTDLLFYKLEVFAGQKEMRAQIANEAENNARAAGVTDPDEILVWKEQALAAAGFVGENYYRRAEDVDPLEA